MVSVDWEWVTQEGCFSIKLKTNKNKKSVVTFPPCYQKWRESPHSAWIPWLQDSGPRLSLPSPSPNSLFPWLISNPEKVCALCLLYLAQKYIPFITPNLRQMLSAIHLYAWTHGAIGFNVIFWVTAGSGRSLGTGRTWPLWGIWCLRPGLSQAQPPPPSPSDRPPGHQTSSISPACSPPG